MKIPVSWLREYVAIDMPLPELERILSTKTRPVVAVAETKKDETLSEDGSGDLRFEFTTLTFQAPEHADFVRGVVLP